MILVWSLIAGLLATLGWCAIQAAAETRARWRVERRIERIAQHYAQDHAQGVVERIRAADARERR
jgi:hypothetical protein